MQPVVVATARPAVAIGNPRPVSLFHGHRDCTQGGALQSTLFDGSRLFAGFPWFLPEDSETAGCPDGIIRMNNRSCNKRLPFSQDMTSRQLVQPEVASADSRHHDGVYTSYNAGAPFADGSIGELRANEVG